MIDKVQNGKVIFLLTILNKRKIYSPTQNQTKYLYIAVIDHIFTSPSIILKDIIAKHNNILIRDTNEPNTLNNTNSITSIINNVIKYHK